MVFLGQKLSYGIIKLEMTHLKIYDAQQIV